MTLHCSALRSSALRLTVLLVLGLLLNIAPTRAQFAVQGDTVYTMAGAPIPDGVVLVEGTTIEAVGPATEVDVPDGYQTLEAAIVTPGLIDPRGTVGVSGLYNVEADQDQLDTSAPMQPELRAIDAYNPQEDLVAFVRGFGITTVHTGHAPGALISGQTGVFATRGSTVDEAVRKPLAAVAMTLGPQAGQRFESPGTSAKGVAMLRSTLLDAQAYMEAQEAGEGATDLGMEVLAQVLRGEVPALITAHRSTDIQAALRLQEEFGFEMILDGAAEAYLLTGAIQAADVPVLLHPTMIRPYGPAENAAFTTAGVLHEAGIPVAIQSGWEPYVPKTRIVLYEAAIAAAHGLPRMAALASITRTPAEILGLSDRIGTLEAGKTADIALFDGDPFEYTTHVCQVLLRGELVSNTCN
jgi:imidazolonepropionase-like amidohydrolase